ncbi:MAG TPA: IspD/TarI family cytidylyltransferase [Candidatus Atribacteria bacterium]|nr:IspD/TarI family cytidylyltransferase [Candidatus Atribacteria bacterium]
MNVGVIFAGGAGTRMNSREKPKQFLEVHGKPIIVHTIEIFERAKDIDAVVVACIEGWIPYMEELKYRYRLDKIRKIVPGGETGQLSIYNGLCAAESLFGAEDVIVLIHDGVRPLINEEILKSNIESVKKYGSAITCSAAKETFVLVDDNEDVYEIPSRKHSRIAKAPQSFYLKDIIEVHRQALKDGITNSIDSCTLMHEYGKELAVVDGPYENIKITTPDDFYMFRALFDARENRQLADG